MSTEFTDDEMRAFLLATAERSDLGLWTHGVADMSGPRRTFVLIWELNAQVCNGGFRQYAHNTSGEGAPYIVDALIEIGAHATARLAKRAIDLIGDTDWTDEDVRQAYVNELDDAIGVQLDDLDQAFFKWEDDLDRLLFNYLVKNIEAFPPPQ